jgi:hypothetical protein
MGVYVQSNAINEWFPAKQFQIDAVNACLEKKSDVEFETIVTPEEKYRSVCRFVSTTECYLENLDTRVKRKIFVGESPLPEHEGI